jgi:hypothetical protein
VNEAKYIGLHVHQATISAVVQGTEGRRHGSTMNLRKRHNHSASWHYLGGKARPSNLRLAVAGEAFLLTSHLTEHGYRTYGVLGRCSFRLKTAAETPLTGSLEH